MSQQTQRLNILYLHTHDAGRYVEPYGHAIPSPNVQKLAERGVLFRQAFNVAPTCSPSRSGLVTGRWTHCNGMFGLTGQGWSLNDYSQHIARFLSKNGYETALAGAQHVAKEPRDVGVDKLGYERILTRSKEKGGTGMAAEDAARWFLEQKHDRPFFLTVGFGEPHRYNPGDPDHRVFNLDRVMGARTEAAFDRGIGFYMHFMDVDYIHRVSFKVAAVIQNTLSGDRNEVLAFQKKAQKLYRIVNGTSKKADEIVKTIKDDSEFLQLKRLDENKELLEMTFTRRSSKK